MITFGPLTTVVIPTYGLRTRLLKFHNWCVLLLYYNALVVVFFLSHNLSLTAVSFFFSKTRLRSVARGKNIIIKLFRFFHIFSLCPYVMYHNTFSPVSYDLLCDRRAFRSGPRLIAQIKGNVHIRVADRGKIVNEKNKKNAQTVYGRIINVYYSCVRRR